MSNIVIVLIEYSLYGTTYTIFFLYKETKYVHTTLLANIWLINYDKLYATVFTDIKVIDN